MVEGRLRAGWSEISILTGSTRPPWPRGMGRAVSSTLKPNFALAGLKTGLAAEWFFGPNLGFIALKKIYGSGNKLFNSVYQ